MNWRPQPGDGTSRVATRGDSNATNANRAGRGNPRFQIAYRDLTRLSASMINATGAVIILLALLVNVQVLFFLVQVLGSLSSVHGIDRARGGRRPKVCVIVPEHNESVSIAKTIAAIKPQLTTRDRLVVVADNCSDDTATIAALEGAEVIERHDQERVGKGYALAHGIQFVGRSGAPEVVILVD